MNTMITTLGTTIGKIIGWCGDVIGALFGTVDPDKPWLASWASIMPFIYLGIAVTLVFTGVHVVKSFTFGRK